MLDFFRKHQRIFFLVIAVVTIISFTFFGTYRAMNLDSEPPDRKIAQAIDGSAISEREMQSWEHFLSHDRFLDKEFLSTGLADVLVERYFDLLKPDLEARLKRIAAFRPYVHPKMPFLSAQAVWQQFAPGLGESLVQLQAGADEASAETFKRLIKVYVAQAEFSGEMLKRALLYQQQQFSWIPQDPRLMHADFSLFGFHTMEEWFGPRFLQLTTQVLMNASLVAQERGLKVSKEEVQAAPLQVGLSKKQGIEIWRKLLLFRHLFNEKGETLFLGSPQASAQETLEIDVYQLPKELQLKDFRSLLRLQYYLETVAPKIDSLTLPSHFFAAEKIEKQVPELIKQRFVLEVASATLQQLFEEISLKETWEWELDANNWSSLKNEFSILAQTNALTREERFVLLDGLEDTVRLKVDRFARQQIVRQHPEWIETALTAATPTRIETGICLKGEGSPLPGVKNSEAFLALLQKAPLKSDQADPLFFTPDQEQFYRIWVVEKVSSREIMTFEEGCRNGVLDKLLDKRLEEAYPEVRKRDLAFFQLKGGGWKDFQEVKNEIGAKVYADVLKLIEESDREARKADSSLDFYAHKRLTPYVQETRAELMKNDAEQTPWKLIKKRETLTQTTDSPFTQEAFSLAVGAWSGVRAQSPESPLFFHLLERKLPEGMTESQKSVVYAAQREKLISVLEQIDAKKVITLTEVNHE